MGILHHIQNLHSRLHGKRAGGRYGCLCVSRGRTLAARSILAGLIATTIFGGRADARQSQSFALPSAPVASPVPSWNPEFTAPQILGDSPPREGPVLTYESPQGGPEPPGPAEVTVPVRMLMVPYWVEGVQRPLRSPAERTATAQLEQLVWSAIENSPHVQALLTTPRIRETEVEQAQGLFDPSRFANSIWNDRSDPVGNTLTTGGASRLNENLWQNSLGVRNKNRYGGNWEATQSVDLRDNNSLFFVPKQQADTKMMLRYTQPLMRGAGKTYNRSTIGIAECQVGVARHDAQQALQTHALEITQAYWQLFSHRSQLIQLRRGIERLSGIASELERRGDYDVVLHQQARARAHIESLRSQYTRALSLVVQAESQLRAKVNASWLDYQVCDEIVTDASPLVEPYPIEAEMQLDAALATRPDLLAIRDEIRSSRIRLCIAENELKPTLNLVTDLYVRGLDGNYDYGQAVGDQFGRGAPSYSGGLEFVRPKSQTVAKAIRRQRHLEMQQLLFRLEDKLLTAAAEIRSQIAEVDQAFHELRALEQSALATKEEVEYTVKRWQNNAILEPAQISLTLDQLLEAEMRLVRAENNWSVAQADYMISIAKLHYATGTLLAADDETSGGE